MGRWYPPKPKEDKGENSMNKAILMGRIGQMEMKQVGGHNLLELSLATSKKVKGEQTTQWHKVKLWGKAGEALNEYSGVGKRVMIEGEIEYRTWDKQDGTKAYSTEINAHSAQIIDFKDKEEKQSLTTDDVPF